MLELYEGHTHAGHYVSRARERRASLRSHNTDHAGLNSTITATATAKTTRTASLLPRNVAARQVLVTPSSVPSYASACKGSEYSSACSCFSITRATTTVATPSTTKPVTVTTTVTVPAPCPEGESLCPGFLGVLYECVDLQSDENNCGFCGNTVRISYRDALKRRYKRLTATLKSVMTCAAMGYAIRVVASLPGSH